jgi:hypothetical protein
MRDKLYIFRCKNQINEAVSDLWWDKLHDLALPLSKLKNQ